MGCYGTRSDRGKCVACLAIEWLRAIIGSTVVLVWLTAFYWFKKVEVRGGVTHFSFMASGTTVQFVQLAGKTLL